MALWQSLGGRRQHRHVVSGASAVPQRSGNTMRRRTPFHPATIKWRPPDTNAGAQAMSHNPRPFRSHRWSSLGFGRTTVVNPEWMLWPHTGHRSKQQARDRRRRLARWRIAESSTTFVLLPALDLETCVAEIVRRQVHRPLGLVASREQAKLSDRFTIYMALPAPKVTTLQAPDAVVAEIISVLQRRSTQRSNVGDLGAVFARITNR
jgi:hypothetical protein